ncbi:MAG: hypothetical protein IKK57_09185 [Clostridia bacterium]|nr:hypothetical protein [Clostridia bacterium]
MNRTRMERRILRHRKIRSRCALLLRIGGAGLLHGWTHGAPGRMSKGKMHCSCWYCRQKLSEMPDRREMRQRDAYHQQLDDIA